MAVYIAYSDESAVADSGGEFLVGGYVAAEQDWPYVVRAWQERVLDGPPKLPYMHMSEIRRPEWRATHSISSSEADWRTDEAVRVIYAMGAMSALASYIKRSELAEVFHSKYERKKQIPTGLDEPDYFCFTAYTCYVLGELRRAYPDAERVDMVVSRKQTVSHHIVQNHGDFKKHVATLMPDLAPLLGEVRPAPMETTLPLQASDVLLWHLQRYFAKKYDRVDERRIWMLTKERDGHLHEWERFELEEMAQKLGVQ
jgi:hypothetical protein